MTRQFGKREPGRTYVDRPGSYAVIRSADGRLLLVEKNSRYFLPGGGFEDGETSHEALHREVREETGMTVIILREIGRADEYLYALEEKTYFNKRGFFFQAEMVEQGAPTDSNCAEPGWFRFSEVRNNFAHESHLWAVLEVLENPQTERLSS